MLGMREPAQRLLVIGLDAAEITLIERWRQEGFLPHLNALFEEGTSGRLDSTAEMLSGSVWPSLFTGTLPGKHGRYYPLQPLPGRQGVVGTPAGSQQYPFWATLNAAGKHCVILDIPFAHLLPDFRGIQIYDWGTYDKCQEVRSLPVGRLENLVTRWGHHPLERPVKIPRRRADYRDLLNKLLTGISVKTRGVRDLLATEPWDFFFAVFSEPHPAGHYFWNLDGRQDSDSVGRETSKLNPALQQTYIAVDHAIGEILESVDRDTTVLVLSGHGMEGNRLGSHLLPEVLHRLRLLAMRGDNGPSPKAWMRKDWLKMARDFVPLTMRQSISRHLGWGVRNSLSSRWASADIDWRRTHVFCLPTDLQGYLRINLRGREPEGIVNPGPEFQEVCTIVSAALGKLVKPLTGQPVVQAIFETDAMFPGPCRHHLPDLVVTWADCGEINAVHSPGTSLVSGTSPDSRPGNHSPMGFFVLRGPQIPQGRVVNGGHICDIAPTILASFGMTPPKHMDGRVWTDAIAPRWLPESQDGIGQSAQKIDRR